MNFLNTWQELEEIYKKDFAAGSNDLYYHFYSDFNDLINSLVNGRIYSNKNETASQLDVYADRDEAYVCMTIGSEGKKRTAYNFKRPLGISFKDLAEHCYSKGYAFNPEHEYSQFMAKTQYSVGKSNGTPTYSNTENSKLSAFRDFRVLAIGALGGKYAGYYFISGGQGRNLNNHWSSKLFTNGTLYKTLRTWFLKNMENTDDGILQSHTYYRFKNNTIGKPRTDHPEDIYLGKVINTDGQLNPNYIPWIDKPSDSEKNSVRDEATFTHNYAVNFEMAPGCTGEFKEIIGVGPFIVESPEGGLLLKMDLVKSGSGGYAAPVLFGANEAGDFADEISYPRSNIKAMSIGNLAGSSQHYNLQLDKKTSDMIAELYNESEYRVYIPRKRDMVFTAEDIATIVLPAELSMSDGTIVYLGNLITVLDEKDGTPNVQFQFNDKRLFTTQLNELAVIEKSSISDATYKSLSMLIILLQDKYKNVEVELIGEFTGDARPKSQSKATAYSKNENTVDKLPSLDKVPVSKTRYVVDDNSDFNIMNELSELHEVPWNGVTSVIGKVNCLNANARLGAETIIVGKDSENRKYVLFVDNAHKSMGFLELPGGGLHNCKNNTIQYNDFKTIAKQRLYFKGGIDSKYISDLKDTGKGLLLHEKGVAKDKQVKWAWSYYKLFTAYYTEEIDATDLDYNFDNTKTPIEIRAHGEGGYTCYLKWIPIETLDYNRAILDRYSNLAKIIKSLADAM